MDQALTGLYRNQDWVFLTNGRGARMAVTPLDYEQRQHQPPLGDLIGEIEYHERVLAGTIKG